jgi:hypothetical protein
MYSGHPKAGKCLIVVVILLFVVDTELYYRHKLQHRSWEFEPLFLIPTGAWIIFFIVAASYYLLISEGRIRLFTNGGLSVAQPEDVLVGIFLGNAKWIPTGPLLNAIRNGKPTALFSEITTEGKKVSPLSLYVLDGRLYCDFDILAGQSRAPIVVRHNEIEKPLPPGWMSNNNDVALEIVDQNENPTFQMYYEGPREIVVKGIFAPPEELVFFAGGLNDSGDLVIVHTTSPLLLKELREFKLHRLFKYPRAVFPGVPN